MQYSHSTLLTQMMDKGVNQQKILEYFKKEGYKEAEIIAALNDYERQKETKSMLTGDGMPEIEVVKPNPKAKHFPVMLVLGIFIIIGIVGFVVMAALFFAA